MKSNTQPSVSFFLLAVKDIPLSEIMDCIEKVVVDDGGKNCGRMEHKFKLNNVHIGASTVRIKYPKAK